MLNIEHKKIVAVCSGQFPVPLTKQERKFVINELPGRMQHDARGLSDVVLCRQLVTYWSVEFVKKATGKAWKGPVNLRPRPVC